MTDLLKDLQGQKFRTICADPPWKYGAKRPFGASREFRPNSWDKTSIGAMTKYPLMNTEDICALPVADVADNDAHLYLWTTNAFMREAHEVAEAWGFRQKTILTWCKVKPDGTPSMKMGYYFRGATEHCLFAVRGKMRLNVRNLPTAFLWPRIGQHSRKPDSFFEMVETATPGPRLELFARRARPGWVTLGNEADGLDMKDSLVLLAQGKHPCYSVEKHGENKHEQDV